MKYVDSLETFKSKRRMWKPNNCLRRICKNFIPNVGFWKQLNKILSTFCYMIYDSGFGLGVKRPNNFAVTWLFKTFISFIS